MTSMTLPDARERKRLLQWVAKGLAAVNPERRVAETLRAHNDEPVALVAVGKAATCMARGAADTLAGNIVSAFVIAPELPVESRAAWHFQRGDHPVPGEDSLAAGRSLRDWLHSLPADIPLLVLVSGGGSALVELPVAGLGLSELQHVNRWLLGSGLDIGTVNAVRARFSMLKRGGLLRWAGDRAVRGLVVSDVPGDRIEDVASGLLSPDPLEWPEESLPDWLSALHADLPLPPEHDVARQPEIEIISRNADALAAIESAARSEDFPVLPHGALSGYAAEQGVAIAKRLREGPVGVHLFGGETTVRLPDQPGHGGRNQHLALAAALELAGCDNICLLSLGTDGVDGNTEDAGALVDGGTCQRVGDAGMDPADCLATANSNAALAAAGDVIHIGSTGTNVADIVIAVKYE